MDKSLNVGVIGVGFMGEKHVMAYDKMPMVNLRSVCDQDKNKVDVLSKKLSIYGYTDYNEILNDNLIDAVSICLPDNMHYDVLEAAIKSHKHILIEKPLTTNLSEGRAICKMLKDYNKVFMVGHILRFDPRFSGVKKYIKENKIGDIVHVSCRRSHPLFGALHNRGSNWSTDIIDHAMVHDIDFINWIIESEPKSVFAKDRKVVLKQYDMTDTVFALIKYENGVLACLEACWVLPDKSPVDVGEKVEVVGTKGVVYIDSFNEGIKYISDVDIKFPDSRYWPDINGVIGGAIYEELTAFINCIVKAEKPISNVDDAIKAMVVIVAIKESLKTNTEIEIESTK